MTHNSILYPWSCWYSDSDSEYSEGLLEISDSDSHFQKYGLTTPLINMTESHILSLNPVIFSNEDYRIMLSQPGSTGNQVRQACRKNQFTDHTSGLASGYAQANVVILPAQYAYDFLLFCVRNPKPCPLLEVTDIGNPYLKTMIKPNTNDNQLQQ